MAGTSFVAQPAIDEFGPSISNETLALGVVFFSFVIFGACLWVSVTYLVAPTTEPETAPAVPLPRLHVPCERDGSRLFIPACDVLFVRADGHYTQVYTATGHLFCSWPITEATKRLLPEGFLQSHRSYLVNPAHVARFERAKDKGRCFFNADDIPPAPVSRSKLKPIQDALSV